MAVGSFGYTWTTQGDNRITLDQCSVFSKTLSPQLDETVKELKDLSYCLEVSSPGLFREIKTSREFDFYQGKRIKVHTKKQDPVIGTLQGFNPDTQEVTFRLDSQTEPEEQTIPLKQTTISLEPDVQLNALLD